MPEPYADNGRDCRLKKPFYCEGRSRDECIDQTLTCNGISECSNGRDESIEICGELTNIL